MSKIAACVYSRALQHYYLVVTCSSGVLVVKNWG